MAGVNKKQSKDKQPKESKREPKVDGEKTALAKLGEAEVVDSNVEQIPPEMGTVIKAWTAMFSQVSGPFNPLLSKFKDEHIKQYLDGAQADSNHDYDLRKSNRWFYLVYAILGLAIFAGGVAYLLPRDKDLLHDLITIIVVLGGGLGAGYGISRRHQQ
jgi:hypothetical protein